MSTKTEEQKKVQKRKKRKKKKTFLDIIIAFLFVVERFFKNSKKVFAVLIASLFAFVILGCLIESYTQINDWNNKIVTATSTLSDDKSENVRLKTKLESMASVKNVEEYAEDVLGMVKLDPSQVQYIDVNDEDEVTLPEKEESIFVRIKIYFTEMVDYLRG